MKCFVRRLLAAVAASALCAAPAAAADVNADFAAKLWSFVGKKYPTWKPATVTGIEVGPPIEKDAKSFGNSIAQADLKKLPADSVIVTEHSSTDKETKKTSMVGITVRCRVKAGYDPRNDDWYWAYYLPNGTYVDSSLERNPLAKNGFVTLVQDGRLWIFRTGSKDLADFKKNGELAKQVVLPGAGPLGMTVKSPDAETVRDYTAARTGFVTKFEGDRLWVFRAGSKELAEFNKQGELAKQAVRPGAGPRGCTLKAPDAETIDAYLYAKPYFVTIVQEGRVWVFREGSKDLAEFRKNGELAKQVVRPGAGPGGATIKAPDQETITAYLAAREGFRTVVKDDRIWVFRAATKELSDYLTKGEPAQHVVHPGAGPLGMTIKAPDDATIEAYLASR